eukprot:XP_001706242.1 Hypothetical protein GL50803_116889 [Giardia lamblia ATCC 50803]
MLVVVSLLHNDTIGNRLSILSPSTWSNLLLCILFSNTKSFYDDW